jgi:hypothetical protein
MTGKMFDDHGRLIIPEVRHQDDEASKKVIINAAYCPMGHNIISVDHLVSGSPAILLDFEGIRSGKGRIALSAILGDSAYTAVEGTPYPDDILTLTCTHCGTPLDVLADCFCQEGALTVMAYLYKKKDPHQAIAFCNVLSCPRSAVIRSGEVLRSFTDQ